MKNHRILNALEQIDEKYIEEAAPNLNSKPQKKTIASTWIKWGSVAACATIAVIIGISHLAIPAPIAPDSIDFGGCDTEQTPVIADNLPMLTAHFESDGMGFEGLMFYDIAEIGNGNPWTEEAKLITLPVYRNLAYVDSSGIPIYLSDEEMLQLAEKTAAALTDCLEGQLSDVANTTIKSIEYSRFDMEQDSTDTNNPFADAYSLTATTNLGDIRVSGNGEIAVFFEKPISLPETYGFTYGDTSDKEALEALEYLTERFSALQKIDFPLYDTYGDYTFAGEQTRTYRVYEGNGTIEEQILNYNFNAVSFSPNQEGDLWIIRFGNILNSAEKIGDYPLITADAAQKLLLDNHYITSVPAEYLEDGEVKKEHIAKVELVYRTGNINEVFMPYYRFYVELTAFDDHMAEGLKNYGAYYVPAVSGEYLSDFPVWDGSFN